MTPSIDTDRLRRLAEEGDNDARARLRQIRRRRDTLRLPRLSLDPGIEPGVWIGAEAPSYGVGYDGFGGGYGYGNSNGDGNGFGSGDGNGFGSGDGNGTGFGNRYGNGTGFGYGRGYGYGASYGYSNGNGYACIL